MIIFENISKDCSKEFKTHIELMAYLMGHLDLLKNKELNIEIYYQ